jgi:hypothetical protein
MRQDSFQASDLLKLIQDNFDNQYYINGQLNTSSVEEGFDKIPTYYLSDGIEASKVVAAFQGDNYNIGTALTYLMRAGKKVYVNSSPRDSMEADIKKAINHLNFELDRLNKTI